MSGDGARAGVPVAGVPLSGRRPPRAGATSQHRFPAAPGLPRPQWRVRLNGSVQGGIAVAGSAAVAASTGVDIAAFRAGPGRGFSAGRAASDGERVYTAAADGYARAHDLRTGREA